MPHHIAIVMDGNGRWAQNRGLMRIEGHRAGMQAAKQIVQCCVQTKIAILSLFAFSSENWSRPEAEVEFLMQLFINVLAQEVPELHQNDVRICFTGEQQALPTELCLKMQEAEALTKDNKSLLLNIVVNYGGKWDLVQATKKIAQRVCAGELALTDIDECSITEALSTNGLADPDLLIRTSGEQRISNFFLWQIAYTELYFTETLWPDFNEVEFHKALAHFNMRERRYGKILQTSKNY